MDGAELMRNVARAVAQSDFQPLLDAIHDDIVWKTATKHEGLFRFDGEYKNRLGVSEILAQVSMDYTFHHFRPIEILTAGDVVWGLFDVEFTYDAKGKAGPDKSINLEMAFRWRLKDGKIVEHQGFWDTASLMIQQGSLEAPVQP